MYSVHSITAATMQIWANYKLRSNILIFTMSEITSTKRADQRNCCHYCCGNDWTTKYFTEQFGTRRITIALVQSSKYCMLTCTAHLVKETWLVGKCTKSTKRSYPFHFFIRFPLFYFHKIPRLFPTPQLVFPPGVFSKGLYQSGPWTKTAHAKGKNSPGQWTSD